jgi:DUF3015 family protein
MRWSASILLALMAAACGSRPLPAGYAGDDAKDFVIKHRTELEAEIATGSGPRLYDLAILADCQDMARLGRRLHQRREGVLGAASSSDGEVAERVVRFMADNRDLRCLNLDLSRQSELNAGRRHIGPSRSAVAQHGAP